MAVLDHNEKEVSWLGTPAELTLGETGVRVLRGSMLVLAGVIGLSLAIALDPLFNLFA